MQFYKINNLLDILFISFSLKHKFNYLLSHIDKCLHTLQKNRIVKVFSYYKRYIL